MAGHESTKRQDTTRHHCHHTTAAQHTRSIQSQRRSLLAPATLRMLPEYQLGSLTTTQRDRVKKAVGTAILTIQQLVKVWSVDSRLK